VFDPLPGEGQWATALLADGNIGIGGHPARLLGRCAGLVAPDGQILVETEPADDDIDERLTAWLEHPDGRRGPAFPWARLGTAALLRAAADADLRVTEQWREAGRAFVRAVPAIGPRRVTELRLSGNRAVSRPCGCRARTDPGSQCMGVFSWIRDRMLPWYRSNVPAGFSRPRSLLAEPGRDSPRGAEIKRAAAADVKRLEEDDKYLGSKPPQSQDDEL
jgi:hypothetical protein